MDNKLIPAAVIAAAIIIYGLMQMYVSNAQRYQLHETEQSSGRMIRIVFDKRAGRIYYVNGGGYYDAVDGEDVKRKIRKIAPEKDDE